MARRDGEPLGKGLPNQLIKATGWDNWIDEDDEDIRIFDLGEAFLKGAEPENLPQPSHLRAPETIFLGSCDSRHDLWRAGIMVRSPDLNTFDKCTDIYLDRYTHSYLDRFHFNIGTMTSWLHKWFILWRICQWNGGQNGTKCDRGPDAITRYVSSILRHSIIFDALKRI